MRKRGQEPLWMPCSFCRTFCTQFATKKKNKNVVINAEMRWDMRPVNLHHYSNRTRKKRTRFSIHETPENYFISNKLKNCNERAPCALFRSVAVGVKCLNELRFGKNNFIRFVFCTKKAINTHRISTKQRTTFCSFFILSFSSLFFLWFTCFIFDFFFYFVITAHYRRHTYTQTHYWYAPR